MTLSDFWQGVLCRLLHTGTETTETTNVNSGGVTVTRWETTCLECGRRLR